MLRMPRLILRSAMNWTLAGLTLCVGHLHAQATANRETGSTDVAAGFVAQRSLQAGSNENFWMRGGSFEAGNVMWRRIGPVVNLTGSATGSVGASNAPLSLLTVTAGPRVRLRSDGKWSPYAEVLFGLAHGFNATFPSEETALRRANGFALRAGGGVDVKLRGRFFVRAIDVSYVQTQLPNGSDGLQSTLQIGAGVGLIFGHGR